MENLIRSAKLKKAMWRVSNLTVALCLLLSINAIGQAPPPTDPYIANVTSFGATANDGTDDTQAIQNAINDVSQNHPGGTVLVPDGIYWVKVIGSAPWYALSLKSNITFKMSSGALIRVKPTDSGSYFVLDLERVTNVNIVGGTIQGERHQHLASGDYTGGNGQWGYGIYVNIGSSNVYIDGVTVKEMWGDGVTIGGPTGGDVNCNKNINLYNVTCDDNRRQGMSIMNVDGMTVKYCAFTNTIGTSPESGIDIEPWGAGVNGEWTKNIQFINCRFDNNAGCGLILSSQGDPEHGYADISNVSATGCTMNYNRWANFTGRGYSSGLVVTDNVMADFSDPNIAPWDAGIQSCGSPSQGGIFSNNHIYNSSFQVNQGIWFQEGTAPGGNTAQNNDVHGLFNVAVLDAVGGNTISGNTLTAASPTIYVPATGLDFGNVAVGDTSTEKIYLLAGCVLTADVIVTVPTGYEVSKTSGTGFVSSVTVTQTASLVSQFIYVRFVPTAIQAYNDNITNSSTDATTQNVALTGNGTVPDVQAPTVPTGLVVDSITHTSVTLSWTASTDSLGVSYYEVFNGGVRAGVTYNTSLEIIGLTCNTAYSFTVRARDHAGNWSDTSTAISVNTIECDTIAPSVPDGLGSTNVTSMSFTLSWNSSTDNYGISGYDVFKNGVWYGSTSSDTTFLNIKSLSPSTSYSMTVKSKDGTNISAASVPLIVNMSSCALPSGWKGADIGTTGQMSCESDGIFSIVGKGTNISGTADQFRYAYKSFNGDATIIAKVLSIENTNIYSKSGVMIRENLSAGSKFVDCIITPPYGGGVYGQYRSGTNGSSSDIGSIAGFAPYWIKLERIGNNFNTYCSPDGENWTQVGSTTAVIMSANALIGLAVTSQYSGVSCTSLLSNVSITSEPDTLPPSVPVGLSSSSVKPDSFTLKWKTSTDNFRVADYEVFKDGVSIGKTSKTFMNVTGLLCNTNYPMTVKAFDESSNQSEASEALLVGTSICTGIGDDVKIDNDLVIYPNPAKSSLTIANVPANASISVLTIEGKIVAKVISKGNKVDFDVSKWNKGLYFIEVKTESSVIVKKVIVE